jgi:hypothetical protein
MNSSVKSFFPLVVALAATSVFANQGAGAAATSDNAESQPTQSPYTQPSQQTQPSQPSALNSGRITLFEYPNFSGPRVTIDNGMARNLDWASFNNPLHAAASVKVESGNWKVCSQPALQGDCRVIGPGEYPQISLTGIASAEPVVLPLLGMATTH